MSLSILIICALDYVWISLGEVTSQSLLRRPEAHIEMPFAYHPKKPVIIYRL